MEHRNNKKITCPNCGKTGDYKITPKYCCYCGYKFNYHLSNQNKLILSHNKGNI